MIKSLGPQLIYTAAFGFCALWCVWEIVRSHGWVHRFSHLLHLSMAVAMIIMVYPKTMDAVPLAPQTIFFGLTTVWFIGAAIWAQLRKNTDPPTHGGAGHFVPHAIMMAAMTWHLAAMMIMRAMMAGHGHGHNGHGHGHGGHGHGGHEPAVAAPAWEMAWQVLGWVLFGALLAWGLWSLVQAARGKSDAAVAHLHKPVEIRLAHLANGVMSVAMFAITMGLLGIKLG